MKTKVVQPIPRIIFNVFKVFKFSGFQVFKVFRFPAPVWLSDIFYIWLSLSNEGFHHISVICHWDFWLPYVLWPGSEKMSECQTKAGIPGMYECFNVLNYFRFHVYAQNLVSHFLTLTLTLFQSLIQSLSTCWTSFVFISMLKIRCL